MDRTEGSYYRSDNIITSVNHATNKNDNKIPNKTHLLSSMHVFSPIHLSHIHITSRPAKAVK